MSRSTLTNVWNWLRRPVVGPLLRNGKLLVVMTLVGVFHAWTAWMHWSFFPCPMLKMTGCPCPGCGMSRSVVAAASGDMRTSIHYHAYGPLMLLVMVGLVVAMLLPRPARLQLANCIEKLESRTAISGLLLGGLVLYWLFRIVYLQQTYVRLMRG